MAKFGVYRVENSAYAPPHTEIKARDVLAEDGVYKFRDQLGKIDAAFPARHFYVIRLEG